MPQTIDDTHDHDKNSELIDNNPTQSFFTIGDLSREFGVTLRALRFYEDKKLLSPRRDGQNRLYSRRERSRLRLILMGKRVGFSLKEIRNILDLYELKDGQVPQLRAALKQFDQQLGNLEQKRKDLEQAIAELSRTKEVVAGMLRAKEGRDI